MRLHCDQRARHTSVSEAGEVATRPASKVDDRVHVAEEPWQRLHHVVGSWHICLSVPAAAIATAIRPPAAGVTVAVAISVVGAVPCVVGCGDSCCALMHGAQVQKRCGPWWCVIHSAGVN
eukprot:6685687-Prymnesium_polylepis.1